MTKKRRANGLYVVSLLLLSSVTVISLFYHLGEAGIQSWDEARHAVNAYEMFKNSEWLVNTYRYETDYFNFKPPLSMWAIMAGFKLFGVGAFAVRFGSAVALLLTFVMITLFLAKNYGKAESICFAVLFPCCHDMIFFHMGRSGDADALFMLFFVAGMICLYYALKNPVFLYGFGLCCVIVLMERNFSEECSALRLWKEYRKAVNILTISLSM